jgi:hypothetical protein
MTGQITTLVAEAAIDEAQRAAAGRTRSADPVAAAPRRRARRAGIRVLALRQRTLSVGS